jgi:hypothetical protein
LFVFVNIILKKNSKKLRITFRLYMTFWPAHKAMRSIAAGQNVAEKNPTKAHSADWGFS